MRASNAAALLMLSGIQLAQAQKEAVVTVEASHGGAGNGLTNTTLNIPLELTYTNSDVLGEVSYLFLTGAKGVPLNSISCTPYKASNGQGEHGNPFNSTSPSLLSTNTVIVGSIVCKSSGNGNSTTTTSSNSTTSMTSASSSSSTSSTSTSSSATSTSSVPPPVATATMTSMVTSAQATVISTETASPVSTSSANPTSSTTTTTTSAQPGLSTGSSGAGRTSAFVYSGLAVVGLVFAFSL